VGKERIEMGVSACLLASRSLKSAAEIDAASYKLLLLTASCLLLLTVDFIVRYCLCPNESRHA